jgi:hypothetical protein
LAISRPIVVIDCMIWLLRIVGLQQAPTFMALTCRWRSRPQHQLAESLLRALIGKRAKILSLDHVEDLLVFAGQTRHPIRNQALVMLSVKAGMGSQLTCG